MSERDVKRPIFDVDDEAPSDPHSEISFLLAADRKSVV